ncbi:peptidoglycan-binding domain-containing protein [Streptomyces xiamenensis]|uniref:peptidoglycan-binding domain-containing protein n=1 Tax=Streptomyces xiamenensis TaxID=408015 RepID=UPI0036EE466E
MRTKKLTKTLVTFTALAAIGAGGLVTAGTAVAAPAENHSVATDSVRPLTVNNLGLTTEEAKNIQRALAHSWDYTGPIDGLLGTDSWKALQRHLAQSWGYTDAIDGIAGPNTIKALQRYLAERYGYTGAIDGIAGPATTAAFKRVAARCATFPETGC